jgi:hypothetical protein
MSAFEDSRSEAASLLSAQMRRLRNGLAITSWVGGSIKTPPDHVFSVLVPSDSISPSFD